MKHRTVVANFILRWVDASKTDQQVALFRRSHHPNVRSYQGKYAPVSGSIESKDGSPLQAAEREIFEETQLIVGDDIVLEFCGLPYSFEDNQAGRSWTVHAFGWILNTEDGKIKIDWEHDSWEWFDPQVILDGSKSHLCVPKLDKSLQRVYFGPNGMFRGGGYLVGRGNTAGIHFLETIEQLKNDTENGARVLASRAIEGLNSIAECFRGSPFEGDKSSEYWHGLQVAAYHFIHSSRPSMNAAIGRILLHALQDIQKTLESGQLDPKIACQILQIHQNQKQSLYKLTEACKAYIDQYPTPHGTQDDSRDIASEKAINLITISSSSTVLAALDHLIVASQESLTTLNLTVLESRPQFEGSALVSSLLKNLASSASAQCRLNIRIVPESHTALLFISPSTMQKLSPTTFVILGADRISPFGNTSNKTGSLALAALAKTLAPQNVKVIVLSESTKIAPADSSIIEVLQHHANLDTDSKGTSLTPTNQDGFYEIAERDLRSGTHERHPPGEVYRAWPEEIRDHLSPLLDSRNNDHPVTRTTNATMLDSRTTVTLDIDNIYFETVPSSYIDVYITEEGETSREDIMRISIQQRKLEDEIFKDLYD